MSLIIHICINNAIFSTILMDDKDYDNLIGCLRHSKKKHLSLI